MFDPTIKIGRRWTPEDDRQIQILQAEYGTE